MLESHKHKFENNSTVKGGIYRYDGRYASIYKSK